jgi:hypothetical protein
MISTLLGSIAAPRGDIWGSMLWDFMGTSGFHTEKSQKSLNCIGSQQKVQPLNSTQQGP